MSKNAVEIYQGALSPTGFRCDGKWSMDDLVRVGKQARLLKEAFQWALGDIARHVETEYGEGSLATWAKQVGVSYDAAKKYQLVADRFEKENRFSNLSWTHHLVAAPLPKVQRERWLKKAADGDGDGKPWSKARLEKEIAGPEKEEEEEGLDTVYKGQAKALLVQWINWHRSLIELQEMTALSLESGALAEEAKGFIVNNYIDPGQAILAKLKKELNA